MAILPILHYPDPRLRQRAEPVTTFDTALRQLVDDMAETMYSAPGVGLAAPQVGVSRRLFLVDIADEDEPSDLHVFINPVIVARNGEATGPEGCLSFPGMNEDVARAKSITVRAQRVDGSAFSLDATELLAVAIQHELDHLEGVLMIDRLGALRKRMAMRKFSKK